MGSGCARQRPFGPSHTTRAAVPPVTKRTPAASSSRHWLPAANEASPACGFGHQVMVGAHFFQVLLCLIEGGFKLCFLVALVIYIGLIAFNF
ncbi:MAG: hypothetical protein J0L76_17575, partial [Rhodobacterales bacterium]|nr:hypothetical protein [Rhodobacterales bacterium]